MKSGYYKGIAYNGQTEITIIHSDSNDFKYHHDWMDNPQGDCCTSYNGWTEIEK